MNQYALFSWKKETTDFLEADGLVVETLMCTSLIIQSVKNEENCREVKKKGTKNVFSTAINEPQKTIQAMFFKGRKKKKDER